MCVCVCGVLICVLECKGLCRSERAPEAGIKGSCESPNIMRTLGTKLNSGSLKEHYVFLTTEPSSNPKDALNNFKLQNTERESLIPLSFWWQTDGSAVFLSWCCGCCSVGRALAWRTSLVPLAWTVSSSAPWFYSLLLQKKVWQIPCQPVLARKITISVVSKFGGNLLSCLHTGVLSDSLCWCLYNLWRKGVCKAMENALI